MKRYLDRVLLLPLFCWLVSCGSSSPVTGTGPAADGSGPLSGSAIQILSNRADLISGGDALVQVVLPASTPASAVTVSLNGSDVSAQFSFGAGGAYMGLVGGMAPGRNTITANYPGGSSSYALINHPSGGPLIAGPQQMPWSCQQGSVDAQCNQPPAYAYVYISSNPLKRGFQTYDPANPASDVAGTTTDGGITVPFIVRVETGYLDRDQYKIAALYQPGKPWTAVEPQPQFNHKLLISHGALCGASFEPVAAPSVTDYAAPFGLLAGLPVTAGPNSLQYALGAGFVVMSTALDNSGHDCDVAIQAESLIMAKERVIEQYGTLRYTMGSGCSGGSLAMQWIANAYPGIYQGILPTCSFPDAWSTVTQVADYHLLVSYFGELALGAGGTSGVPWTPVQAAAVEGSDLPLNAVLDNIGLFPAFVPGNVCPGTTAATVYNARTNPGGDRCGPTDLGINVFAPRAPAVWSAVEKQLGHGFAGIAADNVGVQYGLSALQKGLITPHMFLDLNAKIGGLNIDLQASPDRLVADQPALANAYRSGMINEANNLGQTAIIDCRGPDPGLVHDAYRAFAIRARLDRETGGHANQLIWEGPALIFGDTACNQNSLIAMDRWLAAVEKDQSPAPLAQKIIADKPSDLGDACFDGVGNQLSASLCGKLIVPVYGTARTAAGESITTDANKCQLKPLNRGDDYGPSPFTDAQWAQMQALFPDGVCDFNKPGVSQQPTIPWQTYQDARGQVIYGGIPLPAAPVNSGSGWAGPAFRSFAAGL
ncbi:MAG: DUF6351 family protein [Nevskia sp.]|nr:DUF6351 family protein [Nevskia sp.]